MSPNENRWGVAGHLANAFIQSKLTLLLVLGAVLIGAMATVGLPREEEPQINVPMFDIFVPFPGASAKEVEERIINVGERRLWEIPGVEYIYSTAEHDGALFIVRFAVGSDPDEAMTRVYTKTFANADSLALGVGQPLIKPRSIDDVPILTVTWSSKTQTPLALRRLAMDARDAIRHLSNVSETQVTGGRRRQLLVHINPEKLAERRIPMSTLSQMLRSTNVRRSAGHYNTDREAIAVETDAFVRSAADLQSIVVGVSGGRPVRLSDVANVLDTTDEDENNVVLDDAPAVTLAVSIRKGANATHVAERVMSQLDELRSNWPADVTMTVTRNYGETAKDKSDELLFHVLLATLSVTLLMAIALGIREALVVLVAIPVTLALTLAVYYGLGYTLNRITLFALIFSIGILVDDAIVVVENIHRHFMMKDGRSLWKLSVDAVDEVGNPTLLATFAVIAAILPMAFVSGLMGPYMRPIPVGASVAMLFSVGIAFVISPWAFAHLLQWWRPKDKSHTSEESWMDRQYRRLMGRLLDKPRVRAGYFAVMALLLLGAVSLFYTKTVTVKMLPFDNKDEFQVVLNMPESASFRDTDRVAAEMSDALPTISEVKHVTRYVGTAGPVNFNGLVRHYYLRDRPNQAELVVNLSSRHDRKRQSHAIAKEARSLVKPIADRAGARVAVAEIPPGPPVLSTLVFEIYGPDENKRVAFARELKGVLAKTEGVVDVDSYVPDPQSLDRLIVNRAKATLNGIPADEIAATVATAMHGESIDIAHDATEKEPVEVRLRFAPEQRRDLSAVRRLAVVSRNGTPIPLSELTVATRTTVDRPIYHKNLQEVTYVIADVAGEAESPVYAILALREPIQAKAKEMGLTLDEHFTAQPPSSQNYALKWDGEWHITYEVFRDLGIAFALVLVLIYVLVVGWFRSFLVPFVIMVPIPLTLVGILPGHALLGAYFTATSMIGFIAGAGIVVRNSIILVDFIQLRQREGMPLRDAVIDAGAVRFRPMLLTAAAVVVGAGVILSDPIFQGLAVSLMAGEVASTLLSRTAVPVLYYVMARNRPLSKEE